MGDGQREPDDGTDQPGGSSGTRQRAEASSSHCAARTGDSPPGNLSEEVAMSWYSTVATTRPT